MHSQAFDGDAYRACRIGDGLVQARALDDYTIVFKARLSLEGFNL